MSSIKELSLSYDPVNESNTFSSGDLLQGRVFLEVAKEVKIDSLYIKCKGDADVRWSEGSSDDNRDYRSHERYFKLKQYFIQDPSKKGKEDPGVILTSGEIYSNVVKPGRHVYPFSFQLPHGNLPPCFKGNYGSIKYILEVTVDRSWKMDRNTTTEIFFVPRTVVFGSPLMNPQSGSTDKKMKLFTSGSASLRATIDKMGYMQGEVIQVSTNIENTSSRDLKLKYCLEQKQVFSAEGSHKYTTKTIFKVVGDPIPSGSKSNLITNLTIPSNLEMTISNCSIIKVDYVLKVYLDVPYASDPEIKFPVIILPAGQFFGPLQGQPGVPAYGGPNQPAWGNPAPQPGFGPPPPGAAFGPPPPGTAFGPTPGPYLSQYPPASDSPAPPPSYSDIYPNSYSAAPGSLAGPSVPTFSPPQYPGVEFPTVPQPLPSAPDFFQHPTAPPYGPADGPGGFWQNTPNAPSQPNSYPTKSESHE